MKDDQDFDELLNSFIDGELTAEQMAEVKRVIACDEQLAKRLRELRKCKILIGSLPRAEAPSEILEGIRASLERKTFLARQLRIFGEHKGVRNLLARKVLAAAAMVGLVAVLAATIYVIVGQQGGEEGLIISDWDQPIDKDSYLVKNESYHVEQDMNFDGRLELKTKTSIAVEAFINRAIEDNGYHISVKNKREGGVYALSCSRETLNLLLADLENVWAKFDSTTLFVQTDQAGSEVVVKQVSAEQIAEIINQETVQQCVKVAKDFSVLNNIAEILPGKEILAVIDDRKADLITIPKPVLTSNHRKVKRAATGVEDEEKINLTIVVIGNE